MIHTYCESGTDNPLPSTTFVRTKKHKQYNSSGSLMPISFYLRPELGESAMDESVEHKNAIEVYKLGTIWRFDKQIYMSISDYYIHV